jgi:hypothetical protein
MPSFKVSAFDDPLLNIASYARRGPGRRDHLTAADIAQISRSVRRVPEVVVKAFSKGSSSLSAVREHVGYISRDGALELETDDGGRLRGKAIGRQLLEDWDLDVDDDRRQSRLSATAARKPKLVHKLVFSMPAGTPAEAVRSAARNVLREAFALKHRYAFVLHTDERHPHVHALIKAVSEQGIRLHIWKPIRQWRQEFARHLRAQGVEANATGRAVRGENRVPKLDGIYRAARRGASTHMRERAEAVARELQSGHLNLESGKSTLVRTRMEVVRGWRAAQSLLINAGEFELAAQVDRFVQQMRPPQTEKEMIAEALLQHARKPLEPSHPAKFYGPVK